MSLSRFYCEQIAEPAAVLTGPEAHHLTGVMRLGVGSEVEVFDGRGTVASATVTKASKREVALELSNVSHFDKRTNGRIVLAVSLAKSQRFDWLISKCTELGVDHIAPILYSRTVKQASGKNIIQRYEKLAIAAAKQCKSAYLPQIDAPKELSSAFEKLSTQYPTSKMLISSLAEGACSPLNSEITVIASDKIVFVGPEGGFTDQEEEFIRSNGAQPIRLTETILRIETAAIAMASILTVARDNS